MEDELENPYPGVVHSDKEAMSMGRIKVFFMISKIYLTYKTWEN